MESIVSRGAGDKMLNTLPQEKVCGLSYVRRGYRRSARMGGCSQNFESLTDLHDNVAAGNLYLIHQILKSGKFDVNSLNKEGETALSIAINCGQKDSFRLLLEHGADPNIRSTHKIQSSFFGRLGSENGSCHARAMHRGISENSPLWKMIKFRDLEWCQLLMEAGYCAEKDEEKGGWIQELRQHLKDIEKRKNEEKVDLSQAPFNRTYTNFLQWYDNYNRQEPLSLVKSCRYSIRSHLQQIHGSFNIFATINDGFKQNLPNILHNYLLMQDERMLITINEFAEVIEAERAQCVINIQGTLDGLNVSPGC